MSKKLVVVTGGSGFIASHIIAQLLQAGYAVRTTVRDVEKKTSFDRVNVTSSWHSKFNRSKFRGGGSH